MRWLGQFIMQGRWQAAGVASLFGILSWMFAPASFLSGAAIGLVSLRLGSQAGMAVLLAAAAIGTLGSLVLTHGFFAITSLALALWLPVWVCSQVLRTSRSQGLMLAVIGVLAMLFAAAMRWYFDDVELWWLDMLQRVAANVSAQRKVEIDPDILRLAAKTMNALAAAFISVSLTLNMLFARWWQGLLYNPGAFRVEAETLQLPRALGLPVALLVAFVAGMFAYHGEYFGLFADVMIVTVTLYFFQGLAVIHHSARVRGWGKGPLIAVYAVVLLLPNVALVAAAALGLLDHFTNIRRLPSGPSAEN